MGRRGKRGDGRGVRGEGTGVERRETGWAWNEGRGYVSERTGPFDRKASKFSSKDPTEFFPRGFLGRGSPDPTCSPALAAMEAKPKAAPLREFHAADTDARLMNLYMRSGWLSSVASAASSLCGGTGWRVGL